MRNLAKSEKRQILKLELDVKKYVIFHMVINITIVVVIIVVFPFLWERNPSCVVMLPLIFHCFVLSECFGPKAITRENRIFGSVLSLRSPPPPVCRPAGSEKLVMRYLHNKFKKVIPYIWKCNNMRESTFQLCYNQRWTLAVGKHSCIYFVSAVRWCGSRVKTSLIFFRSRPRLYYIFFIGNYNHIFIRDCVRCLRRLNVKITLST